MFVRTCGLLLLLASTSLAQTPPAAPGPAQQPKPTKACVRGAAINAATKEPLKRAVIMLIDHTGHKTPIRAESDDSGKFEFRDLDSGKYILFAEKQGFARQAYGSRGNPLVGATISVVAGQEVKDVVFACIPNAVIAGKVLDDTGEPVANVIVMVLRNVYRRGKKDLVPMGAANSNDLGEYRVANLGPGRYLVVAVHRQLGLGLVGSTQKTEDGKPRQGFVATYYPNATDVATAAPVEATAGAELRGIDIRLAKASVVGVKGKVTGIPVPVNKQMLAWLTPKGAGILGIAIRQFALIQANEGTFEFKSVAPGSYTLTATAADGSQEQSGALSVDVGDREIEGLTLALGTGPDIQGTVTVLGEQPVSVKGAQVVLEGLDMFNAMPARTRVEDDSRFTLKSVAPDRYLVHVTGGPQELYVKSIRYGNQDVLESGIDCSSGAGGPLEIRMAADGASIDGVVTDADDKPMSGVTVALIPDSRMRARYKSITTDQRGSFQFKGVAPGNYKLLAWEMIDPGAHEDPEFVRQYESKAEKVAAKQNAQLTFQLKAIPAARQ